MSIKSILVNAAIVSAALISLSSCSSIFYKTSPEYTEIDGPLGEYFQVVDRSYPVILGSVKVEVERIAPGFPLKWEKDFSVGCAEGDIEPGFSINTYKSNGESAAWAETNVFSDKGQLEAIGRLKTGSKATLKLKLKGKKGNTFAMGSSYESHITPASCAKKGIEDFYGISSTRQLTYDDLKYFDANQLRIIRNQIYAHHGYMFIHEDLQEYFGKFSWYTPVSRNVKLPKLEFKNVATIRDLEKYN